MIRLVVSLIAITMHHHRDAVCLSRLCGIHARRSGARRVVHDWRVRMGLCGGKAFTIMDELRNIRVSIDDPRFRQALEALMTASNGVALAMIQLGMHLQNDPCSHMTAHEIGQSLMNGYAAGIASRQRLRRFPHCSSVSFERRWDQAHFYFRISKRRMPSPEVMGIRHRSTWRIVGMLAKVQRDA